MRLSVLSDGLPAPHELTAISKAIKSEWEAHYSTNHGAIDISPALNSKVAEVLEACGATTRKALSIRNPDILFVHRDTDTPVAGVELTAHSPDGSNIEKRVPFLWAAQQVGFDAFIATPYQKQRPNGSQNRFPSRHASWASRQASQWIKKTGEVPLRLILPTKELQGAVRGLPASISSRMAHLADIGRYVAHRLALAIGETNAGPRLDAIVSGWVQLLDACAANGEVRMPDSRIALDDTWIQIFNARPDTGHWERGEGQFDSIDGRVMFTLEEIADLPAKERPKRLELWLPQMTASHPWIVEQVTNDLGSKRIRNLLRVLPAEAAVPFSVRFAESLNAADWRTLRENPSLTLERLDFPPGVYTIKQIMGSKDLASACKSGARSAAEAQQSLAILSNKRFAVSTHRAYKPDWQHSLVSGCAALPASARVLAPRLPAKLLAAIRSDIVQELVPAEHCQRSELIALRQAHKASRGKLHGIREN